MCEEPRIDPKTIELIKLIEEQGTAIKELRGRIDGVGTCSRFLL